MVETAIGGPLKWVGIQRLTNACQRQRRMSIDAATEPERWTIGRMLAWTTQFLKEKGAESPRLDAEVLLAHVLKYPRYQLYVSFDAVISDAARAGYRDLVKRRAAGAPVAYLVGRKEFYSLSFAVSPAVLIPRPDTETLVAEFLTLFRDRQVVRALDLGTGSGAIALACVKQHKTAQFVATDVSDQALSVATANAQALGLDGRVRFVHGDLYEPVMNEPAFDSIVSNPPYIPTDDIANLEPGVRDFEPHTALDGGADGLELVRKLIQGAPARLVPGGVLLLEIGAEQEAPVGALITATGCFERVRSVRDAGNHPRVMHARTFE